MVLAPDALRAAKQSAADVCPREAAGGNEQGSSMSELFAIMLHPASEPCGVDIVTFPEEIAHHRDASFCQASVRGTSATETIVSPLVGSCRARERRDEHTRRRVIVAVLAVAEERAA
jgi:hypothetical protein